MSFIVWDSRYSVGDDILNYQHKKLFDMINNLYDAILQGKEKIVLGEVLTEMVEYTSLHFSAEENYMMNHHYPAYAEHKKENDILRKQVMEIFNQFDRGENVLSISVMVFLKDWLQDHILETDSLYANYIAHKMVE